MRHPGANAQPWHYIVVTDPTIKKKIADYFVAEASKRAKMKMKFPTPNFVVWKPRPDLCWWPRISASCVPSRCCSMAPISTNSIRPTPSASCCRALFPQCRTSGGGGSRLSGLVGDRDWSGRRAEIAAPVARRAGRPCDHRYHAVRYSGQGPYKRWKKALPQIMNSDRFDVKNHMTIDDIGAWVRETRHKVIYHDEAKVD